jgi:UDP-N-acetylmuramyl pentapeptide synthase
MRELGEEGPVEHRSMIQKAKELGLNGVLVGSVFAEVATADDFIAFADKDAARTYLSALELEGHTILIKGSRGIQLEVLKDIF